MSRIEISFHPKKNRDFLEATYQQYPHCYVIPALQFLPLGNQSEAGKLSFKKLKSKEGEEKIYWWLHMHVPIQYTKKQRYPACMHKYVHVFLIYVW